MMRFLEPYLSPNESKRAVEKFWLLYTPIWGLVAGVVMVGRIGQGLGDLGLMIFGVCLALGAAIGPIALRAPEDRDVPWYRSTAASMVLSVVVLSFGLNYTQTPYFWDVLHMHYGFAATIVIDDNPVFLYFTTVAYFSTYCVLTLVTLRFLRAKLSNSKLLANLLGFTLAPLAMAFLETAMNANPFIPELFCYDDLPLMLWFGTLSYAVAFIYQLPAWYFLDEERGTKRRGLLTVVVWGFAALYADLITLDFLRYNVAPHVTIVEENAENLRDFGEGCLEITDPTESRERGGI